MGAKNAYGKMLKAELIAELEKRDSQASKTARKPKASKPEGPAPYKLAVEARQAENIARGYNPQARLICPTGELGADGSVRFGIQPDRKCRGCGEAQVLEFATALPEPKKARK